VTTPATLAADPVLAALEAAPFALTRPAEQRLPFVFAVPHAGRTYPPSFVAASALSPLALRRSEDAYVDELFESVAALGCPLIAALFPRAYVDANRAPVELDPAMFDGVLALPVEAGGPRVAAGLGVIPRVVRDGMPIYRGKLAPADAERRLEHLYRPYHAALAALIDETVRYFGCAVVVDCHSMPSRPAVPEIVIGDCHGAAAGSLLVHHVADAFAAAGFATARNAPYAGGYTTHRHGRREAGVQALQIEINRALYLDEDRIAKGPGFAGIKGRIASVLRQIARFDIAALRRPLAAE
jgi:N-formylglutamate deformylase